MGIPDLELLEDNHCKPVFKMPQYKDSATWNKVVRPVVHGTYHTARSLRSSNPEEWARAKDQFSKVGTGQTRTEYLAQHRAQAKQAEEKKKAEEKKQAEDKK